MAVLQDFLDNIAALLEDTAHTYYSDAQCTVGLRWALSEYAKMHPGEPIAIDDLDGAVATTLASADWKDVEVGAAGFTALIRSISRVETINMQPDVTDHLKATAEKYLTTFLTNELTLEELKAGHITDRDTAKFAADLDLEQERSTSALALQTAKAEDEDTLEDVKIAAQTARDAALDADNIAMEELKDGHATTRENARYAADLDLEQERSTSALALETARAANVDALEDLKIAAQTARDTALDTDNVAMEELKAGHDIDLQSAKAEDLLALQAAKFIETLTKEEIKRLNVVGKEYMTLFLSTLTPDPGIQVADLDYPLPLKF